MTECNTINAKDEPHSMYYKMPTNEDDYFFKLFSGDKAKKHYLTLKNVLETNYEKVDKNFHKRIKHIEKCFKTLQHFLYVSYNLSLSIEKTNDCNHYSFGNTRPHVHNVNHISKEEEYRFSDPEIYFGFQSLILEAAAILDKLSVTISEIDSKYELMKNFSSEKKTLKKIFELINQEKGINEGDISDFKNAVEKKFFKSRIEKAYYTNLPNRLKQVDDSESNELLLIYNECREYFDGILLNWKYSSNTIRNLLAHNKSIMDLGNDLFCIYKWGNEKLYIDHNINTFPIVGTSKKIIESITYCITKMLSILANYSYSEVKNKKLVYISYKTYDFTCYDVFWKNNYVNHLDYIYDKDKDDISDTRTFSFTETTDFHHVLNEVRLRKNISEKIVK